MGAFYSPASDAARRTREAFGRLLADEVTRETALKALRSGLKNEADDIRGQCADLLLEVGQPLDQDTVEALVGTSYSRSGWTIDTLGYDYLLAAPKLPPAIRQVLEFLKRRTGQGANRSAPG